jgi:hypothetical protein
LADFGATKVNACRLLISVLNRPKSEKTAIPQDLVKHATNVR